MHLQLVRIVTFLPAALAVAHLHAIREAISMQLGRPSVTFLPAALAVAHLMEEAISAHQCAHQCAHQRSSVLINAHPQSFISMTHHIGLRRCLLLKFLQAQPKPRVEVVHSALERRTYPFRTYPFGA